MNQNETYKDRYIRKSDRIELRLDPAMLNQLYKISYNTGISKSELVRSGIRKIFAEYLNN